MTIRKMFMFKTSVTIPNKTGLHARPASQLSALCQKFENEELRIITSEKEIDPKSVIGILSAGIKQGTTIELTAKGPDEEKAGKEIAAFIEKLTE